MCFQECGPRHSSISERGGVNTSANGLGFGRESSSLTIGEQQPFAAELFSEYSVLFLKVLDDIALVAIDPTGEEHH